MPIIEPAFDPCWDELINLAVENGASDDYVEFLRKHVSDMREKASTIAKNDAQTVDPAIAINALLEHPPPGIGFTSAQIEEIVHARNLFGYQEMIDEGTYLDEFLPSLNWWLKVFHALWDSKAESVYGSDIDIEHTAVPEILSLYSTAWAARFLTDVGLGSDPTGLELVKRYWQFRQWVCSLARLFLTDAEFEQLSTAK